MKKEITVNHINTIFIFNATLLLTLGFLMVYYVIQANIVAASYYKINSLSQKLESLNEVHSSLAAQKSSMEDPARILNFALNQNMVEAKDAIYLFENGNVALQR